MAEIVLTGDNFESEVMQSELPVLVDFWATWCGPCRMVGPVVAEIAEEFEGKVKVGKVNVDEEDELAEKFGVQSIPTIILFKNGEEAARQVGFAPKAKLVQMLG
ncbi:MAG: thioredoxin [Clostridiales bacterium]|nr:thioredoxin [Clostridiales bacterium]MBQ2605991.1 thioredoxin [Clostridiales bacterium]